MKPIKSKKHEAKESKAMEKKEHMMDMELQKPKKKGKKGK